MLEIPPVSDVLWDRLVSGSVNHKFGLFAANMALARATRIAKTDPSQKPVLIDELHSFCCRYADQIAGELQTLRHNTGG